MKTKNNVNQEITRRRFMKVMLMAGASTAVDWTGVERLAAAVPNKKDFPIVVIGSGIGGLVSAAYMAQYGFPVTLLEQHNIPGGYATSFDRKGGRFTFDVSLHATVAENGIPQMILSQLGVWDKLSVAYQPDFCRIVSSDLDLNMPAKDPDGVKRTLIQAFPHERVGITGFIDDMVQVQREMAGYLGKESVMNRLEKMTLQEWVDSHIRDPQVKNVVSVYWGYYGLPPSRQSALYYAIATGQYLVTGGQYYKTRSQDLSNTLVEAIVDAGGEVIMENGAERILVEDGVVAGVVDEDGQRHTARAVVANASVPMVFSKLLDEKAVPKTYHEKLNTYHPSLSSFIVWLGLNEEVRGKYEGYEIFVGVNDDPEDQYRACLSGDLDNASIGVTLYDNLFKGYSRPGTSTMSIMTLCGYESWRKYADDYRAGRKDRYNQEKMRIAHSFIETAEKHVIPGLASKIEVMEAATPLTNEYYTGNHYGSIYGYDRKGAPRMNLDVRTPIKGLYLASAWSHGGGYVPAMMAGRTAFESLLQDWNKKE